MANNLKKIMKILVTIFIIVVAIKFFIYALPFIIVLLLGYLVYKKIKENSSYEKVNNDKIINKKNKVFEGEVVKERVDD